jgi:quinoprotein dehydrogenase-associated probable ABC transporter substrate-binding protein
VTGVERVSKAHGTAGRSLVVAAVFALAQGDTRPAAADDPVSRAEQQRLKHERTLDAAIRKLDFGERLLAADHTALKKAAKERKLAALNVCADPGNMPFSNQAREGFQNRTAAVLAEAMETTLTYYWRPLLSRGLTRNTFDTKECDVLFDMPSDFEGIVTTEPVYRTTYVLATHTDRNLDFKSLDDPRLKTLRIGVYQTSSIRTALKRRGIHENVALHTISHDGDLKPENQPWHQVQQVVDGTLDVAGVWGPFAGWMKAKGAPITITPVNMMENDVPQEFSLSIGVRKADQILRYKIELALEERKAEIEAILRSFGVPLVECSKCYIAGDLPAHGIYDVPLAPAATASTATSRGWRRCTRRRATARTTCSRCCSNSEPASTSRTGMASPPWCIRRCAIMRRASACSPAGVRTSRCAHMAMRRRSASPSRRTTSPPRSHWRSPEPQSMPATVTMN